MPTALSTREQVFRYSKEPVRTSVSLSSLLSRVCDGFAVIIFWCWLLLYRSVNVVLHARKSFLFHQINIKIKYDSAEGNGVVYSFNAPDLVIQSLGKRG